MSCDAFPTAVKRRFLSWKATRTPSPGRRGLCCGPCRALVQRGQDDPVPARGGPLGCTRLTPPPQGGPFRGRAACNVRTFFFVDASSRRTGKGLNVILSRPPSKQNEVQKCQATWSSSHGHLVAAPRPLVPSPGLRPAGHAGPLSSGHLGPAESDTGWGRLPPARALLPRLRHCAPCHCPQAVTRLSSPSLNQELVNARPDRG